MNLSAIDLLLTSFFIITISSVISNLYQTIWGYFYSLVNLFILTLFFLFKYFWSINKK